jgi:hypothetical protein
MRSTTTDGRLLKALAQAGPTGLTYANVDRMPGLSQHMAKKRFPGWYEADRIGRKGSGSKTDPYRWLPLPA